MQKHQRRHRDTWSKHGTNISPDLAFSYSFLDQDFNSQYNADQKRGQDLSAFSVLTIIITCLGFAWPDRFHYSTAAKEISIRKVMECKCVAACSYHEEFYCIGWFICLIAFPVAFIL